MWWILDWATALLGGLFLGYDFCAQRMRRRADSYVNRARTRLVVAEQLCERATELLAQAEAARLKASVTIRADTNSFQQGLDALAERVYRADELCSRCGVVRPCFAHDGKTNGLT